MEASLKKAAELVEEKHGQKNVGLCSLSPPIAESKHTDFVSVAKIEEELASWIGAPVILTSSGRAALAASLYALGFDRYHHTIKVPPYLSRCVLNALTLAAFPVRDGTEAHAELLYHQFGFPQRGRVAEGIVIEDIAHAFYATQGSGEREWLGQLAIFSLPKFFGVPGMGGGIVVLQKDMERRVREVVEASSSLSEQTRAWVRRVTAAARAGMRGENQALLAAAYELLLTDLRPHPHDLAGFCFRVEELFNAGEERSRRVRFLRQWLEGRAFPSSFWSPGEKILPFAFPYFGSGHLEKLRSICEALRRIGIETDIYHVDLRRDFNAPDYRPCLLLPCHQEVPKQKLREMCRVVRNHDH